jgi:hypothetical protein
VCWYSAVGALLPGFPNGFLYSATPERIMEASISLGYQFVAEPGAEK